MRFANRREKFKRNLLCTAVKKGKMRLRIILHSELHSDCNIALFEFFIVFLTMCFCLLTTLSVPHHLPRFITLPNRPPLVISGQNCRCSCSSDRQRRAIIARPRSVSLNTGFTTIWFSFLPMITYA